MGRMTNPTRREEPRDLVELAADDAMTAAVKRLREGGAETVSMFVIVDTAAPVPDGQSNSVAAGVGFDDESVDGSTSELVACLLRHATAAMRSIGKDLEVIDLHRPIGQG